MGVADDRRHSLSRTLSGGMQRRLNIACSVLHRPQILLLDERTVGVDPQSRERIYNMLDMLLQAGTAILLTTHQLDELSSIAATGSRLSMRSIAGYGHLPRTGRQNHWQLTAD